MNVAAAVGCGLGVGVGGRWGVVMMSIAGVLVRVRGAGVVGVCRDLGVGSEGDAVPSCGCEREQGLQKKQGGGDQHGAEGTHECGIGGMSIQSE